MKKCSLLLSSKYRRKQPVIEPMKITFDKMLAPEVCNMLLQVKNELAPKRRAIYHGGKLVCWDKKLSVLTRRSQERLMQMPMKRRRGFAVLGRPYYKESYLPKRSLTIQGGINQDNIFTACADSSDDGWLLQETVEASALPEQAAEQEIAVDEQDERPGHIGIDENEEPCLLRKRELKRYYDYALLHAKKELIIQSPWATVQVIDDWFIEKLRMLLNKGVQVKLYYGLKGANDNGWKLTPSDKLMQKVQRDLKNHENLQITKVNNHGKLLVCDDKFCIVGSYNWLSFNGGTQRQEFGVLIKKPKDIKRIRQQAVYG